MSPFSALLRKDLRVELRTLRSLPAMALFAISAFVIFRFGLDRTTLDRGYLNESAVRAILDAHAAGQGDRSQQLWALLMLESWHREPTFGSRDSAQIFGVPQGAKMEISSLNVIPRM